MERFYKEFETWATGKDWFHMGTSLIVADKFLAHWLSPAGGVFKITFSEKTGKIITVSNKNGY